MQYTLRSSFKSIGFSLVVAELISFVVVWIPSMSSQGCWCTLASAFNPSVHDRSTYLASLSLVVTMRVARLILFNLRVNEKGLLCWLWFGGRRPHAPALVNPGRTAPSSLLYITDPPPPIPLFGSTSEQQAHELPPPVV
jgi:hypothetical protein